MNSNSKKSGPEKMAKDLKKIKNKKLSVVTPTFRRPEEVSGLLKNLSAQTLLPFELILVDGATEKDTEEMVKSTVNALPFKCEYIRQGGGTAIQRNVGIETARGDFIAFIDDDIRLEPDFFEQILEVFMRPEYSHVGGIAGYITNRYLDFNKSNRWKWYKRLHLFTTYQPGRYDFNNGYPVNRYLQPPHQGLRKIDFMGANCALWRKEVFERGLRFSEFFTDFGVMEDAHLALRAGRDWDLLECGKAHCAHLFTQRGRMSRRKVARKTAVNYRYLFVDIIPERSLKQEFRFWSVQAFQLLILILYAIGNFHRENWFAVLGKIEGIIAATRLNSSNLV